MSRRPLPVGALAALVGLALILLLAQRDSGGASAVSVPTVTASESVTPVARQVATTARTSTPTPSPTSSPMTSPGSALSPPRPADTPAPRSATPILRIPGIGLQTPLHAEGLRAGRINPPAGSVMWFTGYDRVAPGRVGTSVIAGHVSVSGRPDAFAGLAEVRVGDRVEIVGTDGTTSPFRVVRAEVVDKDDLTTDQSVWGGNSSVPRLAIITCDDAYGFRSDGYRVANYVVIAEPF